MEQLQNQEKPDNERYAPFLYFPIIKPSDLVALKKRLFDDGLEFRDGFPFGGASFEIKQLMEPQTQAHPITARFVCHPDALDAALSHARQNRIIIQLYSGKYQPVFSKTRQIIVPIRDAKMAMKIL
jgi:hypothetical protein